MCFERSIVSHDYSAKRCENSTNMAIWHVISRPLKFQKKISIIYAIGEISM